MEAQNQAVIGSMPDTHLGPALVRGVMDAALLLEIDGELHRAVIALAYPYRPEVGDVVLTIGHEDDLYVIGVLDGKGLTRLDFPGDVELRSAGRMRLEAKEGINLRSDRITMSADRLDVTVKKIRERAVSIFRRVEGTLRTVAGRERKNIEKQSTLHAGKIVRKAVKDVVVDGRQIKLG